MKLSDLVAYFLVEQNIRHVFAISGGASLHLIHSIAETPGIDFICPQHEQAGAMAADGYARESGGMGCAIATSGPGATNLITGICCSYYDSVPVLYITGQVATFRMKGDTGVRQIGFQETDIVEMCKPITKYSTLIMDPNKIKYELQKALHIARQGRPGPVLIDIPDDLQRMEVDPSNFESYTPESQFQNNAELDSVVKQCVRLLKEARRPIIIYGWGIHLAKAEDQARQLIEHLGFPAALTWAARDLFPHEHPLAVGGFGTHGVRYANFAVQNADLILSVGSRLDTKATGTPPSSFARGAKKIMVDIDPFEINKFDNMGVEIDLPVNADAKEFLNALAERVKNEQMPNVDSWLNRIEQWKRKYPACLPSYYEEETINPYVFVKTLSSILKEGDTIVSGTACALAWMMQGFEFKAKQKFFHAFNTTSMGYALPASIGACIASNGKRVICVEGDGCLQMNLQELITVIRHKLPIKILLINNRGHSMVQQTQEMWLDGKHYATSIEGGLAFPDFIEVAKAYGYPTVTIKSNEGVAEKLSTVINSDGYFFASIEIQPENRVVPQVAFGRPNEDAEPLLERAEFFENMIVDPLPVSNQGDP